mmetsp:Transcript_3996/g.13337  ORF Transcript_3996/g.13337 Transcript_3996/m.13337 type:complete len:299 (-) Transcript_3996:1282-2178(-)
MQPMMAMATPGRWPVFSVIWAVTSWRSKSVRPQDGQDTNSVFVLRMREPWSKANDVSRRYATSKFAVFATSGSTRTPSPRPSPSRPPACMPSWSASSDRSHSGARKWCTTDSPSSPGAPRPSFSKRRRVAWRRLRDGSVSARTKSTWSPMALSASSCSSVSSPRHVTTMRPLSDARGSLPSVASSPSAAQSTAGTAPGRGASASASRGTTQCTPAPRSVFSASRAASSSMAGGSRRKSVSVVATSFMGSDAPPGPSTVLAPSARKSADAPKGPSSPSVFSSSVEMKESTEPSRCRRPR